MKRKKIIKLIKIFIVLFLIFIILFAGYIFFIPKKLAKYLEDSGIQSISYIEVMPQGGEEEEQYHNRYKIIKKENIEKLQNVFMNLKLKPYYSLGELNRIESRSWYMEIYGDSEYYFTILNEGIMSADEGVISVGTWHEGVGKIGLMNLINRTTADTDEIIKIRNLILEVMQDEIHEITEEELLMLADEKNTDWLDFERYYYISKKELLNDRESPESADEAAVFQIAGTDCYMNVWYRNAIRDDKRYRDVRKALIYSQDGTNVNLYSKKLREFLEVER